MCVMHILHISKNMMNISGALCHLFLLSLLLAGQVASKGPPSKDAKAVAKWLKKTQFAKQKMAHLHFYFHDTVSGDHPTAVSIAESAITNKSTTVFGRLFMVDDPLTIGPTINSTIIGYARGLYGSSCQTEYGLLMAMNLVFTGGKFKGSTLMLVGYNDALKSPREMPISGGTGVFRLARGVAIANTYYINMKKADAIVEYNVAVLHY